MDNPTARYMVEYCRGMVGLTMDQHEKAQSTARESDAISTQSRIASRRTGLAKATVILMPSRVDCAVVAMWVARGLPATQRQSLPEIGVGLHSTDDG
jgi:hypothetical protein